ncbi:MAG: hypothetical protein ACLSS9_11010 [Acutalibacteraceae bacterium]
MAWEVVKVTQESKCSAVPCASIGYGRLALNVAACELLENYEDYKFVELLTDPSRPSTYGVRFLKINTENSIAIRRNRTKNGKLIGGLEIPSKHHMEKMFGIIGTQNKTTRFNVIKPGKEEVLEITPKR